MFKLSKSETFVNEYKSWHRQIMCIDNETTKKSLLSLLQELVDEVKRLDSKHQDLYTTFRIPSNVDENKLKISEIRKNIKKKLIECERAGLIK
jgi:hypothetical protein